MKNKFSMILIAAIVLSVPGFSQDRNVKDPWLIRNGMDQSLVAGDKMPDIPLGDVRNYKGTAKKISDLKGKIIIFDFWDTRCGSCVANFPHIESLQKEFGDKVVIFLLNPVETQEQIDASFDEMEKRSGTRIKLPDVPQIVNARLFQHLFPFFGIGHHVWIDQDGFVAFRGIANNSNSEKIRELLAGKRISYLNDWTMVPYFNENKNYFGLITDNALQEFKPNDIYSMIGPYDNFYAQAGGVVEGKVDTVHKSKRTTYVNFNLIDVLNRNVFKDLVLNNSKTLIVGPGTYAGIGNGAFSFMYFDTNAKSRYTGSSVVNGFKSWGDNTDKMFADQNVCYEITSGMAVSKDVLNSRIMEDFATYYGNLWGTTFRIEKKSVTCYEIVRSGPVKFAISNLKEGEKRKRPEPLVENGKPKHKFYNMFFKQFVEDLIGTDFRKNFTLDENGLPIFLIDGTGLGKIDYISPWADTKADNIARNGVKTIQEFRELLRAYNLDVVKTKKDYDMVVIRDDQSINKN